MGISREQLQAWGVKVPPPQVSRIGPAGPVPGARQGNKYGVSPVEERTVDGIKFASKKEAKWYLKIVLMRKAGRILWFTRQVPFYLPGGVKYVADFLVVFADQHTEVWDAKGFKTPAYKNKKKMVEALFSPLKIIEV